MNIGFVVFIWRTLKLSLSLFSLLGSFSSLDRSSCYHPCISDAEWESFLPEDMVSFLAHARVALRARHAAVEILLEVKRPVRYDAAQVLVTVCMCKEVGDDGGATGCDDETECSVCLVPRPWCCRQRARFLPRLHLRVVPPEVDVPAVARRHAWPSIWTSRYSSISPIWTRLIDSIIKRETAGPWIRAPWID